MDNHKKQLILTSVLLIVFTVQVYSYSFSAMNGMAGPGMLVINPVGAFPAMPTFEASADLVIGYGFTDRFDCFADLAGIGRFIRQHRFRGGCMVHREYYTQQIYVCHIETFLSLDMTNN